MKHPDPKSAHATAARNDRVPLDAGNATAAPSTRTVLLISGMRENSCRERVARLLETVAGVREVSVNLFRARATVMHEAGCDLGTLVRAVELAGCSAAIVPGQ